MRPAARYCITIGVALGGVSVIIAAPAAPPLHDVQVPAVQLSGNSHENPDSTSPSVADLLQFMNATEAPVVVQNITEPEAGSDGQPQNVPGLSDLLNLPNDAPGAPADQPGNGFVNIGPITPGDLNAAPASPTPSGN
jgi:hypothetical protein